MVFEMDDCVPTGVKNRPMKRSFIFITRALSSPFAPRYWIYNRKMETLRSMKYENFRDSHPMILQKRQTLVASFSFILSIEFPRLINYIHFDTFTIICIDPHYY